MKALAIDGPSCGQIVDAKSHTFLAVISPVNINEGMRQVTYHVHRFAIAHHIVRIASVQMDIEEISDLDVFNALVSDKAKEAVEP
jgi:hypothetical protein